MDEDELDSDEDLMATHCLVFMLVGLDGKSRYPVGFWFTGCKTTAKTAKNLLLECLRHTYERGLWVRTIVFDGLAANKKMANLLGANLVVDDLRNWFNHPCCEIKVYVIFDACHMLKLLRNLLGDKYYVWVPGNI